MPTKRGLPVRLVYLAVALFSWLMRTSLKFRRGGVVVLCYHGVTAAQRDRFRWQMAHIADVAVPSDEVSLAEHCHGPVRPRVVVTFDDAFSNLLENAVPVLRELRLPATVFVVSANLGQPPGWHMPAGHPDEHATVMTGDQVRRMAQYPFIRVGSHTATHAPLTLLPRADVIRELAESKSDLEALLGRPIVDLAVPYGACREEAFELARTLGYERMFTLDPCVDSRLLPLGAIGRFPVSPNVWRVEFLLTCAGAYAWLHPWRGFLRRLGRSFRRHPTNDTVCT